MADAVQATLEHRRQRQIRIAAWVGCAQLETGAATGSRLRHAQERCAVRACPGHAPRRLGAAGQPFVRVHQRRKDGRHAARMRQLSGDELAADRGQLVALGGIEERVGASVSIDQHLRNVQARARRVLERLRHEADQHSSAATERAQRPLESDDGIGSAERTLLGDVDLVLARPNLGVRRLDLDAETAEGVDGLTAQPGRA